MQFLHRLIIHFFEKTLRNFQVSRMNSQNLNLDICLTQLINTNISGTISNALQDHVLSVDISLEKKTAFVTYNEFGITATKIISIIEDCGFDAKEQFKIMFPKVFM